MNHIKVDKKYEKSLLFNLKVFRDSWIKNILIQYRD